MRCYENEPTLHGMLTERDPHWRDIQEEQMHLVPGVEKVEPKLECSELAAKVAHNRQCATSRKNT